jgi:hypothetical protein
MATDKMFRTPITPFTTYPLTLDVTDTSRVYSCMLMQSIEVFAKVTGAATGLIYLLKWLPEFSVWGVYRNPEIADPNRPGGENHMAWTQDHNQSSYFALLVTGAVTVTRASIQGVRY